MLIPQFTLRWLLGVTAAAAVIASIVALGLRGHGWAQGASIALGTLAAAMLVYALLFAFVWRLAALTDLFRRRRRGSSPFLPTAAPTANETKSPFAPPPAQGDPSRGDSPIA